MGSHDRVAEQHARADAFGHAPIGDPDGDGEGPESPKGTALPPFDLNGVLPPRLGNERFGTGTPYRVSTSDLVARFAITPDRCNALSGLLNYREALRDSGMHEGFQWVGGGLVEDTHATGKRQNAVAEVVTFYVTNAAHDEDLSWQATLMLRTDLYDLNEAVTRYLCEGYFVALRLRRPDPEALVRLAAYWSTRLSHRADGIWRGFVEIPLDDDLEARALLERMTANLARGEAR